MKIIYYQIFLVIFFISPTPIHAAGTAEKIKPQGIWKLDKTLKGHTSLVDSVAWNPDKSKQQLASGSWDKTIKIWDTVTGQVLQTLQGHARTVYSVAWSPNGNQLASGSYDKTIKIWDTVTGHLLKTLEGHTLAVESVAWSPDGKWLASGSSDNTIKIWNVIQEKNCKH